MSYSASVEWQGRWVTRLSTDDHYALPFEVLRDNADPANWPRVLPRFWKQMIPGGTNESGATRFIEHIHWMGRTQRVPLRFWKTIGPDRFHIHYELDTGPVEETQVDRFITLNRGYLRVERQGPGVRYRTSKIVAAEHVSAWLYAKTAGLLGYAAGQREFVLAQGALTHPQPFVASVVPVRVPS